MLPDPSAPLLLTREQLQALTGTQQPKRMCAWLVARGWVFEPPARRGDIPKVSRAYHDARLAGAPLPSTKHQRARPSTSWMTEPA